MEEMVPIVENPCAMDAGNPGKIVGVATGMIIPL